MTRPIDPQSDKSRIARVLASVISTQAELAKHLDMKKGSVGQNLNELRKEGRIVVTDESRPRHYTASGDSDGK